MFDLAGTTISSNDPKKFDVLYYSLLFPTDDIINYEDAGMTRHDFNVLGYESRKVYREQIKRLKREVRELKKVVKKSGKLEREYTNKLRKRTDKLNKKNANRILKQKKEYEEKIAILQKENNDFMIRVNNDPKFHVDLEKYRSMEQLEVKYIQKIANLENAIQKLKNQVRKYKAENKTSKSRYKKYKKEAAKYKKLSKRYTKKSKDIATREDGGDNNMLIAGLGVAAIAGFFLMQKKGTKKRRKRK